MERKESTHYWAVEGCYAYGWEEVAAEDVRAEALARLREYRENERGTVFRVRRVKA